MAQIIAHAERDVDEKSNYCSECKTLISRHSLSTHRMRCPVIIRDAKRRAAPYRRVDANVDDDRRCERDVATYFIPLSPRDGDEFPFSTHARMHEILRRAANDGDVVNATLEATRDAEAERRLASCAASAARARSTRPRHVTPVFSKKHDDQYAAIASAMFHHGLCPGGRERASDGGDSSVRAEARPAYVEFGAGRGYLSQFVSDAYGDVDVCLVEREVYRFKAERTLRRRENGFAERVVVDIKDLDVSKLACVNARDVIGMAKHLCGSATDFALRACVRENDVVEFRCLGVALATCCHHRCRWNAYVNRPYLLSLGITRGDFERLAKISSWATLDDERDDAKTNEHARGTIEWTGDERAAFASTPRGEKIALGRLAKALIDEGRRRWCESRGFESQLISFVPREVSPENVLLVARAKSVAAAFPLETPSSAT